MPTKPRQRSRGYCFTLNNPVPAEIQALELIKCAYIVLGHEVGESGTPHIQGYVHYEHCVPFSRVKADFPRAHIEVRKGTITQAVEYCKKDGTYRERGTRPLDQNQKGVDGKTTWTKILTHAKQGKTSWIEENYPKAWIHLHSKLKSLRQPNSTVLQGTLEHEWWYGPTGTGKSSTLWELYPSHFQKELNKWWDGYEGADVIAIEEWSPKNECTGSQLKVWADRYPFTGQIKGGALQKIRPKKIIVLSNYSIMDCFPDSRDYQPLMRRFAQLKFPDDKSSVVDRARSFNFRAEPVVSVVNNPSQDGTESVESVDPTFETADLVADMLDFLDDL